MRLRTQGATDEPLAGFDARGQASGVAESLTWLSALPGPLRHISTFLLTQYAAFPVSPRLSPLTIIRPML
jgi:hypothetical protein